ncbi:hypothetical protein Cni_G23911 [Canna indica]|uniref:NTF2 domain-containing protein n=1 Tax=Canna indica TaxID=4628 RepID=A0AAQ3KV02_9LILI|nr:hypothetical protein Cni_G23911 [Canna indica]
MHFLPLPASSSPLILCVEMQQQSSLCLFHEVAVTCPPIMPLLKAKALFVRSIFTLSLVLRQCKRNLFGIAVAASTTGGRMDNKDEKKAMEEQLEMVAKAFVDHYYNLFDTNRAALTCLYNHTSMLSFEGQKMMGIEEIGQKLSQLPFDHCKHSISTIDCQPSAVVGGILVFVSGNLQLAGEEHQLRFSQVLNLCISHTNPMINLLDYDPTPRHFHIADVSVGSHAAREFLRAE